MRTKRFIITTACLWWLPLMAPAIQITEVMYHPPLNEAQNEWVEIHNETSARRDLSGWAFAEGIDYVFPEGTWLDPGAYLVIAIDPAHIQATYGITNVMGPFGGRLNNSSDHIILFDNVGGIMAEVDYEDRGKWPVSPDGAGHSLAKFVVRGDPMDPDNWRASNEMGGSPGQPNGFDPWSEDVVLMGPNEVWRYFKGTTFPGATWMNLGFDDTTPGWLSGATGIGYGDGDDVTVLTDMQNLYQVVYCRKTLTLTAGQIAAIDQLILEVDHDDAFVAYLNGTYVGDGAMVGGVPQNHSATVEGGALTVLDITSFKGTLVVGNNVLAVEVHNATLGSTDLSFIPRLLSRTIHVPGQSTIPVVLNEVRFNTSDTQYIELYNTGASPYNVGGFYLSNDPDNLGRFQIPAPTNIPGRGHVAFLESQLGFSMLGAGDRILFTSPSLDVVVDARAVEAGPREWTEGRWPDGSDEWYYMNATTGTANSVVLTTAIVINEIMYHAPTDDDRDEYVEIYNAGATPVSLTGWRFSRGIDYDFAPGTTIGAGQYLVIAKDRDRLIARYGLAPAVVVGNSSGTLSNFGEKIRLRDANNNVADEVAYFEGGHWSKYADGYGSSLELIDPRQDNANYQAWAPSDETGKVSWTHITYSGIVNDTGTSEQEEDEFHMLLMGPGEVLIDDVSVRYSATEYFGDNGFEAGMGRWLAMGNHVQSQVITTDAHTGTRCLKIVATGGGDTGANHVEQDALALMSNGLTYTIDFWAKWQYGNNVLVTSCYNHQAPATTHLFVPLLTGTPGAANSVYQANLGPVFSEVRHAPVIPGPSDTVTITARVHDSDGVAVAQVFYKADADGAYASVAMRDDGAGGDRTAGDGIYTGQVPTRPAGQTVAFYLQGQDGAGAVNAWPTDPSRPAHYRVETAPLVASLPTYRIVMTQAERDDLWNSPHLSNEPRNCTFVFDEKDVYYNCGVRFTGSPYGRGGGGYRGFKVTFNNDERLHGVKWQARFDQGQNAGYRDRMSYDLLRRMGQPTCQLEFFQIRLNGQNEGIHEDILPPGKRYLDMFYRGDDDGPLFEVANQYFFTDNNDLNLGSFGRWNPTFAYLGPYKDPYRWYYRTRNHDRRDDFTTMIQTIEVFGRIPSSTTEAEVESVLDARQWLRGMAVRAVIADWDFFGTAETKNAFLYWPPSKRKWQLLAWDCELAYQRTDMSIWAVSIPKVNQFQHFRGFEHYYINYIHECMAKYFTHAFMDPWIDHYYSVVGGVNPTTFKTFIDNRRVNVQSQIASYVMPAVNINITTPDPLTVLILRADLAGVAPANASWVRYRGVEYWLDWTDATHWYVTIDVPPGTNLVTLEFLDYDHQLIGTDSITIIAPAASEIKAWEAY